MQDKKIEGILTFLCEPLELAGWIIGRLFGAFLGGIVKGFEHID